MYAIDSDEQKSKIHNSGQMVPDFSVTLESERVVIP